MKFRYIGYVALAFLLSSSVSSCDKFLDRPTEDGYNIDNFYQNDDQCFQAVNVLYNSPWFDFQRGLIYVGECMSGNYFWDTTGVPYMQYSVNSSDEILVNMSASLWSVNAYCNTILENINNSKGDISEEAKLTCKGECLVWKAMAYFYLVRIFGDVPIIHNNTEEINAGNYNNVYKVKSKNVYEYIVMTLKQAIEWLPETNQEGRIDKYTAYGLLAKVYLTRSGLGQKGSRNQEDLDNAAFYAKKVVDCTHHGLLDKYYENFLLANNFNKEALLSWHWIVSPDWTSQNAMQADLGVQGICEFEVWGGWNGPTVDLQEAFGENALNLTRNNTDDRRKATMMMAGDYYDYFWTDRGGLHYLDLYFGDSFNPINMLQTPTGANCAKHIVGDNADHIKGCGHGMERMKTSLSTHILRTADVYLIYAEAMIGNNGSTTDPSAIDAFYKVRHRSVKGYERPSSITWEDVWKERRLELALEGDRWYDYVRWHYYEPEKAIAELKAQKRDTYVGLESYYRAAWNNGNYNNQATYDPETTYLDEKHLVPNVTDASFTLPFPDTDLTMNKNLSKDAIEVDVTQYSYK